MKYDLPLAVNAKPMNFKNNLQLDALLNLLNEVMPFIPFAYPVETLCKRSFDMTLKSNKKGITFRATELDGRTEIRVKFGYTIENLPEWLLWSSVGYSEHEKWSDAEWAILDSLGRVHEQKSSITAALNYLLVSYAEMVHADCPTHQKRHLGVRITEFDLTPEGMTPLTKDYIHSH